MSLGMHVEKLACIRGGRQLFSNLSVDLDPGQLLRVRGANGAGKTSLLRMLCGLLLPREGRILWPASAKHLAAPCCTWVTRRLSKMNSRRSKICWMPARWADTCPTRTRRWRHSGVPACVATNIHPPAACRKAKGDAARWRGWL